MDFGLIEIESIPGPDYNAVARVMEEFNNETRACPCEPSCEEEVYPASVSSLTWPSKKYKVFESQQFLPNIQISGHSSQDLWAWRWKGF